MRLQVGDPKGSPGSSAILQEGDSPTLMRSLVAAALATAFHPLGGSARAGSDQAQRAPAFEGEVVFSVSEDGTGRGTYSVSIKGKRLRVEMGGEAPVFIIDLEAGKVAIPTPDGPARVAPIEDMLGGIAGRSWGSVTIRATGGRDTIAGHPCEHHLIQQGRNELDVCSTPRLSWNALRIAGPARPASPPASSPLRCGGDGAERAGSGMGPLRLNPDGTDPEHRRRLPVVDFPPRSAY